MAKSECIRSTIENDAIIGTIATSLDAGIYDATLSSYKMIYEIIGDKYLIKCHNHIPDILSNYYEFNRARTSAFRDKDKMYKPAACGLGSLNDDRLIIHFIASDSAPTPIENSRQVSAFEYPQKYGPSPMFSRAVVHNGNLYISGTASIVGSETVHIGDVELQKKETLNNIQTLVDAASFDVRDLKFVVYYKNIEDLEKVSIPYPAVYKHCCICRDNLLIEIEATSKNGYCVQEIYS